jgi:dipeptidyl aminopeptidase/acylaminoacyl peptidase
VKDEEPQLYLIAPDGGEARRCGQVATGVEGIRWFPDGRRIAFISWVWPQHKSMAAQAKALAAFKARKESAYVTDAQLYRHWDHHIPMGRVPHLHVMDTATGKVRDLMAGQTLSLDWKEPGADSYSVSGDGRRIVFAFDPADEKRPDGLFALAELDVRSGRHRLLLQDDAWDFDAPVYSHGGGHIAFTASAPAAASTRRRPSSACSTRDGGWAGLVSGEWDREVHGAAALARGRRLALLFVAEDRGPLAPLRAGDLQDAAPRWCSRAAMGRRLRQAAPAACCCCTMACSSRRASSTLTTDEPRGASRPSTTSLLARHGLRPPSKRSG